MCLEFATDTRVFIQERKQVIHDETGGKLCTVFDSYQMHKRKIILLMWVELRTLVVGRIDRADLLLHT